MTEEKKKPAEDEVSEEQLEDVAGGATVVPGAPDLGSAIPDVLQTPAPGGSVLPLPYPNSGSAADGPSKDVEFGSGGTTEGGSGGSTGSTSP